MSEMSETFRHEVFTMKHRSIPANYMSPESDMPRHEGGRRESRNQLQWGRLRPSSVGIFRELVIWSSAVRTNPDIRLEDPTVCPTVCLEDV